MGNYLSSSSLEVSPSPSSVPLRGVSGRKRERIVEFDLSEYMSIRKRRKLIKTSEHIYERLFLEGQDSDVSITALGRRWKLHKVYLEQSPYFKSMFNGEWKESNEKDIEIQIIDPNIVEESLHTAFSSLYRGEMDFELELLVPLLATVSLLQFQGLQEQIEELMIETLNVETVLTYRDAAESYGSLPVVEQANSWLKMNLLHALPQNITTLSYLPRNLLLELISAHDLFVNQTEFSVYILLRLWLFLQLNPKWTGDPSQAVASSHSYFKALYAERKNFFLNSPRGGKYIDVFRTLRLSYLLNHHLDMDMLLSDGIVPLEWLYPVITTQWGKMLRVDQGHDTGPSVMEEKDFNRISMRCGRTLAEPNSSALWRWTGFNMGLDLIVHYEDGVISLRRNFKSDELLLSTNPIRSVFVRVTASSLNEQKQVVIKTTSGLKKLILERSDESHELLRLDFDETRLKYPLCLAFNFFVTDHSS